MYKIVGADQKEYGPVSEDEIRRWIQEGRANGQTIARFQEGPWKPLSTFPEFAASLAQAPVPSSGLPPLTIGVPPYGAQTLPPNTNVMAITGLTLSILGLFCCGPIFATLGLIFSGIALFQISQEPQRYSGRGIAVAGIIIALLGYILFAILVKTGVVKEMMEKMRRGG